MILALETGWTEGVLARMSRSFKAACHWVLYARAIVGPEGFPSTDVPKGADVHTRAAFGKLAMSVAEHRTLLFPEDGDD